MLSLFTKCSIKNRRLYCTIAQSINQISSSTPPLTSSPLTSSPPTVSSITNDIDNNNSLQFNNTFKLNEFNKIKKIDRNKRRNSNNDNSDIVSFIKETPRGYRLPRQQKSFEQLNNNSNKESHQQLDNSLNNRLSNERKAFKLKEQIEKSEQELKQLQQILQTPTEPQEQQQKERKYQSQRIESRKKYGNQSKSFYSLLNIFNHDKEIKEKLEGRNIGDFIKFIENKLALSDPYLLNKLNTKYEREDKKLASTFMYFKADLFLDSLRKKEKTASQVLADLKEPHLWYPEARSIKRKIILHTGPTNSGKTHHALDRLMKSETGVYCGPLRLLAQEVYEKLSNNGIECTMLTGQIRIINPMAKHISCTVELANTQEMVEVAVIDEYQLISDKDRGAQWTKAFLGIPALEIHLCGDGSSIDLIKKLCEITGDTFELRKYTRLSPLEVSNEPVNISQLRKGDCVVTFSKKSCIQLKELIEKRGKKCAILYGSLPPIVRIQQAKIFNETNDADILVATDCIGMGLNLNISRIIFTTISKFDGRERRLLKNPEIRQIGGRAGRFKSDFNTCGQVTSLEKDDIKVIRKALESQDEVNPRAGLFPPSEQLELYGQMFGKNSTFSELLKSFVKVSNIDEHYFLCYFDRFLGMAERLDHIKMSIPDKYIFTSAPFQPNSIMSMQYLQSFALGFSKGEKVSFPFSNVDIIDKGTVHDTLSNLEDLYNITDCYLWLTHHFPQQFNETTKAQKYSELVTNIISQKIKRKPISNKFKRYN